MSNDFQAPHLYTVKNQCLRETKKNRKDVAEIDDERNLFSCDRLNSWKATVTCSIGCIGQKLNMINADDEIDVNVTKAVLNEHFKQNHDESVEECLKEISKLDNFTFEKFGLKCSSKMAQFSYCMWKQLIVTCPVERQKKSKQCKKLRIIFNKKLSKAP